MELAQTHSRLAWPGNDRRWEFARAVFLLAEHSRRRRVSVRLALDSSLVDLLGGGGHCHPVEKLWAVLG